MRLRTKLILAFLLLSVVPLTGITLYTYYSSLRAFRSTVEAEAHAATAEMGARMDLVTEELARRVNGLGELPYDVMLAERDAERDGASRFVRHLVESMGESAPMLQALEFEPTSPPAPPSPESAPGAPPDAPAPDAVMINFSALWSAFAGRDSTLPERLGELEPRVIKLGNVSVVMPDGGHLRIVKPAPGEDGESTEVDVAAIVGAAADYARIAMELAADKHDVEQIATRIAEDVERRAEVYLHHEEDRVRLREKMREELTRVERDEGSALRLRRDFSAPVHRRGQVVGRVKATVDTARILEEVLSGIPLAQGEIPFAVDESGHLYTPNPDDREILEHQLDAGRLARASHEDSGDWEVQGDWAVVPHHEPALGIVYGIARPVGASLQQIRRTTGRNLLYGLVMIGLAVIGIIPLSGRMTRNLSRLTDGVDRLAAGDLRTRVFVRSKDEIGRLGHAFNRMAQELSDQQGRLLAQERLRKEVEMCRQIQADLLPAGEMRLSFADVRAVTLPARELGGDFFNYFALPDGSVALLVGDVSGKGVPAALLMANLQASLRARLPVETDLERLADSLDRELEQSTAPEAYLTLFVGLIDPDGSRLRYVNAGHNTQYLFGASKLERLPSGGRPLGLLSGGGYAERSVELAKGDSLCLFTDGLTEALNARDEEFGEGRLEALLRESAAHDPAGIVARIEEAVGRHRGDVEADDDATLLVLRLDG